MFFDLKPSVRSVLAALFAVAITSAWGLAAEPLPSSAFAYDTGAALQLVYGNATVRQGVRVTPVSFRSQSRTITGELIVPAVQTRAHSPGVLFVHWLGDPKTTNHTEFEPAATTLAKRGATCLLVDAMWSTAANPGRDWFDQVRNTSTDYAASIAQVIDLRRSLDVLLSQPTVDANRIAYVGHDFGAMYGAVLAGVDPRPQFFVLIAGTTSFASWYLLGTAPPDVPAYRAQMAPLDPLPYLHRSQARGFMFQFASRDRYITGAQARAFFDAAPYPKALFFYDAHHDLDVPWAWRDRLDWLIPRLFEPQPA